MDSGIKKIARLSKSSVCTVSLVLNGKANGRVSHEKQEEIRKIAQIHNYRPSHSAKILLGEKSYTIGVAMPRPLNSYYSKIMIAIQECFAKYGYMTFFVFWKNERDIPNVLESIFSRDVDGIISWDYHPCLKKEKMPIVVLNHGLAKEVFDSVVTDYDMVFKNTVDYFRRLGHQHIGYFGIQGGIKEQCLHKYIEMYGLKSSIIPISAGSGQKETIAAAEKYFNNTTLSDIPEAICTSNDTAAICFSYVAAKFDIYAPRDISLIGFDNIDEAILLDTPLTTYDHCFDEIANQLADMLLSRIDSLNLPIRKTVIKPRFIERDSCIRSKPQKYYKQNNFNSLHLKKKLKRKFEANSKQEELVK